MRFDSEVSPEAINGGRGWTEDAAKAWLVEHDLNGERSYREGDFIRFVQTEEKGMLKVPVTEGLPAGVLMLACDKPRPVTCLAQVDGKTIRGKSLAAALEIALPEERLPRMAKLRAMARKADVDLATVTLLLNGRLNCPTRKTLEDFAEVLDMPVSRLLIAAKSDGCDYDEE